MSRAFTVRRVVPYLHIFPLDPYSDGSVSKTVFVAWLLREICSFRDSESYGQYTQKVSQNIRDARALPTANSRRPPRMIVNLIITLLFFGIPRTYYIHVKVIPHNLLVKSPAKDNIEFERVPWTAGERSAKLGEVY